MSGFPRRYSFFPGVEVITQIEGVIIVDLPPPGSVQGVGTGTVCMVGEYQDMTYGATVNTATGVVSTKAQPVEVFSAQDMLNKVGGFDATLGKFGTDCGNAFCAIRGQKYSRLICLPVNLASNRGLRLYRQLPTNKSATNPTPIVPMAAAVVEAGTEFKSGSDKVRTASRVTFGSDAAYYSGTDVATTAVATAVVNAFTSAGSDFVTAGVKLGDIVVVGVIDGAAALGANADTYRVASVTSATVLSLEKLNGVTYTVTTGTNQPFRIHTARTADSYPNAGTGDTALGNQYSFNVLAKPLTNGAGSSSADGNFPGAAATVSPTVAPPTATASSWDPYSGLKLITKAAVPFTTLVQAPNAASGSAIEALYATAIDALLVDKSPGRDVNILVTARTSDDIRTKCKTHVLAASAVGVGRMACISPGLDTQSVDTVIGTADPGVGANRSERIVYNWPGWLSRVDEAIGFSLATADGLTTADGKLDILLSAKMASVLSVLPPERNPGQAAEPVASAMADVLGFQRGAPDLGINEYTAMRQAGIAALRIQDGESTFMSGVTTSLTSGQKNINRRRMADFLEDSLAKRYLSFTKLPITNAWKDNLVAETVAFLTQLQSPNNPAAQRIVGFVVDRKSGNTPDLEAAGIYVLIVKVRSIATSDFIVLQAEVGEGVTLTQVG